MPLNRYTWLVLFAFLYSCTQNKKQPEHSFYYWRAPAGLDTVSGQQLTRMGVSRFYIRYFDVDWNDALRMPVPVGESPQEYMLPPEVAKYTPVVFITNRTFQYMPPAWCDSLAVKLTRKIARKTQQIKEALDYPPVSTRYYKYSEAHQQVRDSVKSKIRIDDEIQIDCDWTASTRQNYFNFLKKFKELNPHKTISVTIRLYPYKYRTKMGVPPVDRGMLMCYNLGGITDPSTRNSVFDLKELEAYMNSGKYPLPLDIALPVFGWYAWFRDGRFKGIVHDNSEVAGYVAVLPHNGNICTVATDTVLDNNYFREGDELRAEYPDEQELLKAAALVTRKNPEYERIAFFDWSELSTGKYEKVVREIFNRY